MGGLPEFLTVKHAKTSVFHLGNLVSAFLKKIYFSMGGQTEFLTVKHAKTPVFQLGNLVSASLLKKI